MALLNTTTTKEFENAVLKSNKTVLVDFWAAWCGPCLAMAPVLDKLGETLDDTVDIVKVNIEASAENSQLANQYDVRSIPNMYIFKDGKVADQIIGMVPEKTLVDSLAGAAA